MGPDSFSCWGITRAVQHEVFGRELPIVLHPDTLRAVVATIRNHEIHDAWPEVTKPAHGDIVLMSSSAEPHHVGTYLLLDGGGILHCTEKEGVTFMPLVRLKALGFGRMTFHTYKPHEHLKKNSHTETQSHGDIRGSAAPRDHLSEGATS